MKKYEFTGETKELNAMTLHRIKALADFANIKTNNLGGWIEKDKLLSHYENCWVFDNARVCDDAYVSDNACVYGDAYICGKAWVRGNACVSGHAIVSENARVFGNAQISGDAYIFGDACIFDNAQISGDAFIRKNARIGKNAVITYKSDWFAVDNVGSRFDTVTFYKGIDGIYVCTGCFNDSLDEFVEAVKERHGDNYFAQQYMSCVELAKKSL